MGAGIYSPTGLQTHLGSGLVRPGPVWTRPHLGPTWARLTGACAKFGLAQCRCTSTCSAVVRGGGETCPPANARHLYYKKLRGSNKLDFPISQREANKLLNYQNIKMQAPIFETCEQFRIIEFLKQCQLGGTISFGQKLTFQSSLIKPDLPTLLPHFLCAKASPYLHSD